MSTFRAFTRSILAISLVLGTAVVVSAQEPTPAPLPVRVLFIGNSHTERNGGLDWLVGNMVAAEDPPRAYEGSRRTASGVTLEYHYNNGSVDAIREGDFDAVVLQSYLPGADVPSAESFLDYVARLDEVVKDSGARTIIFMTWPQGRGDWAQLDDFVAAHRQAEAELGASVAPVGVAFANAQAERPDMVLIGDDTVHATWQGAYLAAATVYATLFDRSPEGLPYSFGLSDDDAAFLQRIAWQTLTDWRAGLPATE